MGAPARLALFAAVLALAFTGAMALGGAVDPDGAATEAHGAHDAHGAPAASPGALRLEILPVRAGRPLRLRIHDAAGRTVRRFGVQHTKRMHLIVVRRDLRGFQHLHPAMAPDGTWTARPDLSRAGVHRVIADFTVAGRRHALGADVHVAGEYRPGTLPAPATVSRDGDLEARLRREGGRLHFDVRRDGRPVDDRLQEHLGARGHLVALRADDLAYAHTHPHSGELAFDTELPSAGAYRLWVQFRLDGRVRTAAFTQVVGR